jgi:hypothetical protein
VPAQRLLHIYLRDHLAGATAGVRLAGRIAAAHPGERRLAEIAAEIAEDRASLLDVMGAVGADPSRIKNAAAWAGERAGRLKLNGRILGRSPLSAVVELEALISGVTGKVQLWRSLAQASAGDSRLSGFDFEQLEQRAERQLRSLEAVHRREADRALRGG